MRPQEFDETSCWYPFWKNGAYQFDFYVEGQRFRRSTGVRCKESLEIAINVAKGVQDAAWDRALSPFPTFEEAAAVYLADINRNRTSVDRLVEYFGPFIRIDEIDPFMMKQCKVDLSRPSWRSDDTARKEVTMPLKAVLSYAFGLRPETRDETGRTRILTPEEAKRLIRAAMYPPKTVRDPKRRLLKMIAFLLGGGATPGEMFCVRAEDANRATGEVCIRGKEVGGRKTRYRRRMIHLPQQAWELIGDLPSEGRVFLSTTGKPVIPDGKRGNKTINAQFRNLCDAAGLGVTEDQPEPLVPYSLRHTSATWFSAQVGDQDLLVDRGGWVKADMARHYRKMAPADLGDRLFAHGWDFRP